MKGKIILLGVDVGLALVVGIFMIVIIGFIGLLNGNAFEGIGGVGGGGTGGGWDCAGVATVPSAYYPWVKDAANKWLAGDEAALIALIQIESGWNPQANAKSSSAAGLGQFITSTAKGYKEFVGGDDSAGKNWPAGQIFDKPEEHLSDDARFDPERAIYAAAHKLKGHMDKSSNNLGEAYAEGYHGYCKDMGNPDCVSQKNAADAARKKLEDYYSQIKSGGGCKQKGATACGVVTLSDADATFTSKHRELMPPAANSFAQIATAYHQKTGKKLGVTSTFRTHDEQEALHDQKPGLANEPGQSMHEAGLAIDVNWKDMNDSEYTWFVQMMSENQWEVASKKGRGSAESWHFDYAALKDQYWYGEPKITNAIAAANSCGGSKITILKIINQISLAGGVK